MDQIKWCLQQKKGIELIEPNDNLRDAYLIKAEEALETLRTTKIKDWKVTTAYYTMYNSIYSLMMKIGIKCEIHKCTIEFMKIFLKQYFTEQDYNLIDKAFQARNDAQYYVGREISTEDYELIIRNTPLFLVKCKNIIIEQTEIIKIREIIKRTNNN